MPKAEIPYTWHANLNAYVTLWYPYVLDTPLAFLPIFLGKACLDTRIRRLNSEFYDPINNRFFLLCTNT